MRSELGRLQLTDGRLEVLLEPVVVDSDAARPARVPALGLD
jgi:hypothetical protein